jgi:hypothetical protein
VRNEFDGIIAVARQAVLSLAYGYAGPLFMARSANGPAGRMCSLEDRHAARRLVVINSSHSGARA